MVQLAQLTAQKDTSHHSRAGASQPSAQRDRVLDVDVRLDGECALVVAAQDVEGDAGEQVALRVEADVRAALALALVGDAAVEGLLGARLGAIDGDVQLEVDRQGEADDVEARANVGAGARCLDSEGLHGCS